MSAAPLAYIGVDVGGTHTDASVVWGERLARGKAFTTYDDFSRGVLGAIEVAAGVLGTTSEGLLRETAMVVNGTTVVTNTITELRGSNVGVLVTRGFKDTFRWGGGPRMPVFDDHLQKNLPDLLDRRLIREVDERIDSGGTELVAIDPDQILAEVRDLVEDGAAEAIAVCYLSSYINPAHERETARVIEEAYPDLFVSLSHEMSGAQGESRRWTTAVLNSFVQRNAAVYLESVSSKLRESGLTGSLAFFQGLGGGISKERALQFPLALLGSGPAGGAIGANDLAKRMDRKHILLGDMGGTSFDTGIIRENEIKVSPNVEIGAFKTATTLVDVISVGAGGGSIAWVSERGAPLVGPHSASSTPGPAAYGRGGTAPTVTDAMIALGFIDADNYLGGRAQLHPDLAEKALVEEFAQHFGWSAEEAGGAVHDMVVANMATAVREVSVNKGYDPRDFLFLAYGGTLPLFAVAIADLLQIDAIVIPRNSSVFCAHGLTAAEHRLRFERTVAWDLSDPAAIDDVSRVGAELVESARAAMREEGFGDEEMSIERSGLFRFQGQVSDIALPIPDRDLRDEDRDELARRFFDLYEDTYGVGTAWKGVPTQLQTYVVTVNAGASDRAAEAVSEAARPDSATPAPKGSRKVFLPASRSWEEIPVYADEEVLPGGRIAGAAIVDATDTTIFIPAGWVAERDEFMNYVITEELS